MLLLIIYLQATYNTIFLVTYTRFILINLEYLLRLLINY